MTSNVGEDTAQSQAELVESRAPCNSTAEFREDSTLRTRNVSRSLCLVAVSLVSATINPLAGQEGTSESNSQSSPDRAALAALYNAAGGPRWKNRHGLDDRHATG